VSPSGSFSGSTSGSVSATATATSTATDLRPVFAAAAAAAIVAAKDEKEGILSSSTILGIVLGAAGAWVVGAGVYSNLYKRKQNQKNKSNPPRKSEPHLEVSTPHVVTPNPVLPQPIPPVRKTNPILAVAQETRATFGPTSAAKRTLRLQDSTKFKVERSVNLQQPTDKNTSPTIQQLKSLQTYRVRKIQKE
jgi:hypothetical protein